MQVTLSNGLATDIAGLSADELDQLHWEQERTFAQRILSSPRGSDERARAMREGYDTVTRIIGQREQSAGGLVMGMSQRYPRLVLRMLRKYARRGVVRPRLFEIGYGSGAILEAAAEAGFDVAGIEVSANMQEQAQARLAERYHGGLFLGDFLSHRLEGADARYHVVYWNDVFEHLPPDESLDYLRKAHELLAPGGMLLTITPNWHVRPSDITDLVRAPRSEAEGFHLKEYTLREMTQLLREAGFQRVMTPLFVTRRRTVLAGGGLARLKCAAEPVLEWLPFPLAKLACRGLALSCTLAVKGQ